MLGNTSAGAAEQRGGGKDKLPYPQFLHYKINKLGLYWTQMECDDAYTNFPFLKSVS